ncbi:MAG: HAMP domain-containing histidine kinase [Microbacteriaceae bacterium]|nr:HAMP domain-containing histidine kinase [Microbacteriaceae bacterium]
MSATLLAAQGATVLNYVAGSEQERILTAYERDAFVLGSRVERLVATTGLVDPTLVALVNRYAEQGNTQVIVVDRDGIGVLSSDPVELAVGTNYTNRPEIAQALLGNVTSGERWSETLQSNLVYVAVPIINGSSIYGAVRLSFPHGEIDQSVAEKTMFLWWVAGAALALSILLAFVVSGVVSRPIRRVEAQANALANGDFSGTLSATEGPREIRTLAVAFNTMAAKLDSLIRQQRAFASDASHQLRTPLTALLLRIESAREALEANPTQAADRLRDAEIEVERLTTIVEGLLAIARSDSGSTEVTPIDVAEIARGRVENWRALAEEHGITIAYEGPTSAPALALSGAVEQIVDNLVDNAIGHSPPGTAVLVRVRGLARVVELTVIDAGPGMTLEQCERAFDRFWRADSTTDGSGLGLAIVKHLAELGRGTVALTPVTSGSGLAASVRFLGDPSNN